ncbi:MAG TPA: 50S ribosomal protein L28 [Gemmatimonadetes bacterium]|nr:50S ribosomal protein L28 [Gemmatimonadota bacterium]
MAKCEMCSKVGMSGNNVSHSKRRTRTRWSANVQHATIYIDSKPKKVKICTRCLRNHYKVLERR